MRTKKLYTVIIFSENIVGLLNQITIIFTRRQLNIETLSVSPSAIKGIHKFTIKMCIRDRIFYGLFMKLLFTVLILCYITLFCRCSHTK